MNEDLQKQLAEMLAKLSDTAQNTATWTGNQLPLLVQEKLVFGRVWETGLFIVVVALAFLVAMTARTAWRDQWDDDRVVGGMLWGMTGLNVALAVAQAYSMLMVWFAPRLYIVEWLHTFIQ